MKITIHDKGGWHQATVQAPPVDNDPRLTLKAELVKNVMKHIMGYKTLTTEDRYEILGSCILGLHAVANGSVQNVPKAVPSEDAAKS